MLAIKDRWHVVNASIPGLADAARISIKECQEALKVLSSPDEFSRTQDFDGRRIKPCDGGWVILNGDLYRNKMNTDERREYQRIKQKEYRERNKSVKSCLQSSQQFTHTDTDTDTDTKDLKKNKQKEKPISKKKKSTPFSQESIEFFLAEKLDGRIRERLPDEPPTNLQVWAKDIDLIIRIDKRHPEDISRIIDWAHDHDPPGQDFAWSNQIKSPKKLRKHFSMLKSQARPRPQKKSLLQHNAEMLAKEVGN